MKSNFYVVIYMDDINEAIQIQSKIQQQHSISSDPKIDSVMLFIKLFAVSESYKIRLFCVDFTTQCCIWSSALD